MFSTVVNAVALLNVCVRLVSAASPGGFPLQDLSANFLALNALSQTGDGGGDGTLKLPFGPDRTLLWQFHFDDKDSPNFSDLMTSLLLASYKHWKDTSIGIPIRQREEYRTTPFSNFLHVIQPTVLGQSILTPLEVGISYCGLMKHILQERTAPGNATVEIYDYPEERGDFIGAVSVVNSTLVGATETIDDEPTPKMSPNNTIRTTSRPNNSIKGPLSMPQNSLLKEKAYLDSLSQVALDVYRHDWRALVVDTPGRSRAGFTLHYNNTFDSGIQASLTLYRGPRAGSVTWDQYAQMTQVVSATIATHRDFDSTTTSTFTDSLGRVLGSVSVGEKWEGTATA